jgi:tartrate dehydratase beta subunit/fumarate hydratase class I family protein
VVTDREETPMSDLTRDKNLRKGDRVMVDGKLGTVIGRDALHARRFLVELADDDTNAVWSVGWFDLDLVEAAR